MKREKKKGVTERENAYQTGAKWVDYLNSKKGKQMDARKQWGGGGELFTVMANQWGAKQVQFMHTRRKHKL